MALSIFGAARTFRNLTQKSTIQVTNSFKSVSQFNDLKNNSRMPKDACQTNH